MIGMKPTQPVAEISTWQNNCAVSCTSIFLINNFLKRKLSEKAKENFTSLFNHYYHTSLSIVQLRDIFTSVLTLPADRQVVIGPILRDFLTNKGVQSEEENMLSDKAFIPLAQAFDFNVLFYADRSSNIEPSEAIPAITIDPSFSLTLRPYYHRSHYDLIMDDPTSAKAHNQSSFAISPHKLPIEKGEEEALALRIRAIVHDRYNPLQQQKLNAEIAKLKKLAGDIEEEHPEDSKIASQLATNLQETCNTFFKRPFSEKKAHATAFKKQFREQITTAHPKLIKHKLWKQIAKNLLLFVATAGIGYLSVATYNKANKGKFFFFHQTPKKKLLESALGNVKRQASFIKGA